jgi:murein L,D-transpeptidase YafK
MKIILILLLFLSTQINIKAQKFKTEQLKFSRVKQAYDQKWESLSAELIKSGVLLNNFKIYIRVFKKEDKLEVWVSKIEKEKFSLFKTYKIVTKSGILGPKRKSGDLQVPEGFYKIDRYNPASNYYLSLGINYPNTSDAIIGTKPLGGDIFIHGSDVTIGCMPLTDDIIKELYVLSVEAKNNGQKTIYVHIFPFEFNNNSLDNYAENPNFNFWKSLKPSHDYFEKNKKIPFIEIDEKGKYILK